ncbi:MAG: glycosyl transferase family 2 [Desulfobacteraceae bacterium IS3]|nr:MAG: glycosyl transferase family 2 [Desulfobacteraceae bacterium IS3]
MKTSVIVTTYNQPQMLKKVLEGLCHQSRHPDEVIVADDGSGQETLKVIKQFMTETKYPLFHIWQEDNGFRAAEIRNKAIKASQGDYIILLDGDCIPEKHFIGDHVFLAEKGFFFQGKRVLVSKRFSPDFTYRDAIAGFRLLNRVLRQDISNSHHLIRLPFFPALSSTRLSGIRSCNMGFFREDVFAVNGFNQDFVGWGREDSEIVARFYKYGLKKKEHPFMAICFHLWHEKNDSRHLAVNDEILRKAVESDEYRISNGLVQ